jgi:hypothetical protein
MDAWRPIGLTRRMSARHHHDFVAEARQRQVRDMLLRPSAAMTEPPV